MITLFASAIVLGFLFCAAPGAVFAETVSQGMHGGFRSALAVQLGSLVGDGLWAILGLFGIGFLLHLDWLRWPIGVAGIVYLLWLARDSWRAASRNFSIDVSMPARADALRAGVLLSVTNPQNVAYWAALGSAMSAVGVHQPTVSDYAVFFVGFMVASVIWAFFCAAAVDRIFRHFGIGWVRVTYRLCAAAFLALALSSARDLTSQASKSNPRDRSAISTPR